MADPRRYEELDSLRGLAALSVVLHHYLLANSALSDQATGFFYSVIHSPLHVFWAGGEAVSLFFVLSGFVLALPLLRRPQPYAFFAAQRTARIYAPYIAAVVLGLLARQIFYHGPTPGLSAWANDLWNWPPGSAPKIITGHALLLPQFESGRIVPVFWSLVIEMRLSLIFPLLLLFCQRVKLPWLVVWSVAIYLAGLAISIAVPRFLHVDQDYSGTIQYTPLFLAGIVLAIHREQAVQWVSSLSSAARWGLFGAAVLCYTCHWWMPFSRVFLVYIPLTGAAGVIFILLALGSPGAKGFLLWRPLRAVGSASYSLYLVHAFVLFACLHALAGSLGFMWACVVAAVLTVPVTWAFYAFVESPAKDLSHRWGRSAESPPTRRAELSRLVPLGLWVAASAVYAVAVN